MKYFSKRFWKETASFALIIGLGIIVLKLFDSLVNCVPADQECYGPLLSRLVSFVDWLID